jgi:hypothetical protein
VYFLGPDGNPLADSLVNQAKKQQGDRIRDLIQTKCNEINSQIEALGEIHLYTPSPVAKPSYVPQAFQARSPLRPVPQKPGFLSWLFKGKRQRIEEENSEADRRYENDLSRWRADKAQFDESELRRKKMIEQDIYSDTDAMETFLEETLQSIVWPRETNMSNEILDAGAVIFMDVDLPEIEDIPNKTASVPQRGYKLSVKDMSNTEIQKLYMRHVHGIGFRIIGETFAALPKTSQVVLSGFSQRPDRSTGIVSDEYLYSVRVDRNSWSRINFDNLQPLDVVEALAQFELLRNMSKTGVFKTIEPFAI